jgi:hypothetical protein
MAGQSVFSHPEQGRANGGVPGEWLLKIYRMFVSYAKNICLRGFP